MKAKISLKQYLRKSRCPRCGSKEVYTPCDSFVSQAGPVGHLYGHCTECGTQWYEIWKVTGFKLLEAIIPEEKRRLSRPWKVELKEPADKSKLFEVTFDSPRKGTAIIVGEYVICNDNGVLKVYK